MAEKPQRTAIQMALDLASKRTKEWEGCAKQFPNDWQDHVGPTYGALILAAEMYRLARVARVEDENLREARAIMERLAERLRSRIQGAGADGYATEEENELMSAGNRRDWDECDRLEKDRAAQADARRLMDPPLTEAEIELGVDAVVRETIEKCKVVLATLNFGPEVCTALDSVINEKPHQRETDRQDASQPPETTK